MILEIHEVVSEVPSQANKNTRLKISLSSIQSNNQVII
jgi:hypothetical protein